MYYSLSAALSIALLSLVLPSTADTLALGGINVDRSTIPPTPIEPFVRRPMRKMTGGVSQSRIEGLLQAPEYAVHWVVNAVTAVDVVIPDFCVMSTTFAAPLATVVATDKAVALQVGIAAKGVPAVGLALIAFNPGPGTSPKPPPTTAPKPPPTTTPKPPPTTTERPSPTTTSTPVAQIPTNIPTIGNTTSSVSTAIQSPRPTTPSGENSVSYSVTDSRITWSSASWTDTTSSCTITARRTTTRLTSFTVMVSAANQLYLNLDCLNTAYNVYVNGVVQTFTVDRFDVVESCTYKQINLGINTVNINVTVVVLGIPTSGRRQLDNNWSFQLNEVLAMTSSSAASATSTPGSAQGLKASWTQGLFAALLAGFGLAL
ncbi:hypothetical protein NP233_g573 [Leucocoprinus birnbaumii]|uniref:Uncharacterized protein n=1 Tax=Leucocoprinus birnbaumii TaxID=56174 RepID=A0AAD5W3L7_9AGAR|nr:hypothetical protein NP233_g573 [Leucocoprinus birnbaumii]